VTAPEAQPPMTGAEGDYLLAAGLGLAQAARLIPVRTLLEHFDRRYDAARRGGSEAGRQVALDELGFADALARLVGQAEQLMEVRRKAEFERAAAELAPQNEGPASQRPLGSDDDWVIQPGARR
jgi:hypothetical protein